MLKVLAVRLDSMGDVLVTGPGLRAIAADERVGSLTLLCSPASESTARLLPGVTDVLTWSCPWIVAPPPEVTSEDIEALRVEVARRGFDEAVIFTSFHQSPLPLALVLRLAGVRRITGVSTDYAGSLLDVRIRPNEDLPDDLPEAERSAHIAAAAGFELPAGDDGRLHITPRPGAFAAQAPHLAPRLDPDRLLVAHPGASVPARIWTPERFRDTVAELTERGWQVAVTGAPAERELTAQVAGSAGIDLGGALDVPGLADLLSRARALVVGNTGPAHLGAAVGTPIVSLFSPVVPPRRWLPYGVPVEMLGDQTAACRGTRARQCPVPGHPCLNSVTPAEVVAAVHRLTGADPVVPDRVPVPVPEPRSMR
ncbi:ADP-heptose:LPS heptosyltransferase [Brevibacterium sanguinis]|uniref:ADP-heptose:LPS heptosyltransferase n=2 Tax=Brevibacterium TaxID=1696 RepID=A0A366IIX9_9MICO|nr:MULTISPECIES: glycosyltransferase family 9 protein [Brevibacterium]RBP65440.1 ADP-heptose:LPS heptosyltransferase [Brevibacterium sanguinis]RBP72074.1 ADP-heptose:LPS heptosyltransferase [Brevibacterium celere]